jgi:hypothetical protein
MQFMVFFFLSFFFHILMKISTAQVWSSTWKWCQHYLPIVVHFMQNVYPVRKNILLWWNDSRPKFRSVIWLPILWLNSSQISMQFMVFFFFLLPYFDEN